jgi:hypothetical protein
MQKLKLIKKTDGWYNLYNGDIGIGSTHEDLQGYKLSKQNCDSLFRIVDVEKLAEEASKGIIEHHIWALSMTYFHAGFNKAMELNKDKVFTESDVFSVVNHILSKLVKVEGFDQKYLFPEEVYQEVTWKTKQIQQLTEIEVEIVMESIGRVKLGVGSKLEQMMPKLDSEGCLILTKKI